MQVRWLRRWRRRLKRRVRYLDPLGVVRRRVGYTVGGLLLFGLLWILATGMLAKRQQTQVEAQLREVQAYVVAGRLADAQHAAAEIPSMVRRGHLLTSGPAWWIAAHIPYFGTPLEIVRGASAASQTVGTEVVPDLVKLVTDLDPNRLRVSGNTVDLAPLQAAAPTLAKASAAMQSAIARLDGLPAHSWLKQATNTRVRLQAAMSSVGGYVDAAARAAQVLPDLLGSNGTRRYFVGLQNEAELRGTGGLPGAFAVVVASKGRVTFTHFMSDIALLPYATRQRVPTGLNFGPDYQSAYGTTESTKFYTNSNVSPHFPYAAQIWAAMWQRTSGEHVDGAIALDPSVLADFLTATGPVQLPDHSVITADQVVSLTEKDQYQIFADNLERKQYLVDILKAVSTHLTNGKTNAVRLARAASDAAKQHRLLVWSSNRAVERVLAQTNYGGTLPQDDTPFVGLVLNNASAGKLDYYLTRGLDYHRSGCGPTRDVIVTITLKNNAPASGLPTYVTTRLDKHSYPVQPGDSRTILDYYASTGAQVLSATLNGKPTTVAVERGLGHPIFRLDLELPRGKPQTLVLHLAEPAGTGTPMVWQQPGVTPMAVRVNSQACR